MQDPKVPYIFAAVDRAGLTMTDLSRLVPVSRETLYRWRSGANATDQVRLDIVYKVALSLQKACGRHKLPLKEKLKPKQRVEAIQYIIDNLA